MDPLSDILTHLDVQGTLYFRTSFTSPWSIRVPAYKNVARFHFAQKGGCFVRVKDSPEAVLLEEGDLIIIPRGAEHVLFCDPATEGEAVQLDTVVEDAGFSGSGALVYGKPGSNLETRLVCGHFAFNQDATHPLLASLPDHIRIAHYGETASNWMESTLRLVAAETGTEGVGGDFIAVRMAEIILAQALRTYFLSDGKNTPVFSAFSDASIGPVLRRIHEKPANPLTIAELSSVACLSRTAFISRFTSRMSMSPRQYITFWRMEVARQALAQSDSTIANIAESVGYQSEAAFGRVFKKQFGIAPARFRRQSA